MHSLPVDNLSDLPEKMINNLLEYFCLLLTDLVRKDETILEEKVFAKFICNLVPPDKSISSQIQNKWRSTIKLCCTKKLEEDITNQELKRPCNSLLQIRATILPLRGKVFTWLNRKTATIYWTISFSQVLSVLYMVKGYRANLMESLSTLLIEFYRPVFAIYLRWWFSYIFWEKPFPKTRI